MGGQTQKVCLIQACHGFIGNNPEPFDIRLLMHAALDEKSLNLIIITERDIGFQIISNNYGFFFRNMELIQSRFENRSTWLGDIGAFLSRGVFKQRNDRAVADFKTTRLGQ